jgi:hypothetical protein
MVQFTCRQGPTATIDPEEWRASANEIAYPGHNFYYAIAALRD